MNNVINNGWITDSFGSVCRAIINGGTPATGNQSYWNGTIPWVTGADFNEHGIAVIRRYISEQAIQFSATNLIKRGNILIVHCFKSSFQKIRILSDL